MRTFIRNSNVDSAKLIQVIAVESVAGNGTEDNPFHRVYEYYSVDGDLLARTDNTEALQQGKWEDKP